MVEELKIEEIIRRVMKEISSKNETGEEGAYGIFQDMNDAVDAAYIAQKELIGFNLETRGKFIEAMRQAARQNVELLSKMAHEETDMGRYEDKILKNRLAIEKTPGIEDLGSEVFTGDDGLTLIELSPYGVIGSISPVTNPSETIICNAIGMIAAGNAVAFSPHPSAKKTSLKTIEILNKGIIEAGGPKNLIVAVENPSIEQAEAMMKHKKINMLVATGGPGVVKSVLSSGKKAIGAGAGNPPAVVDETADIEKAARDIIAGCSFDNNLPCVAEKEVIVVDSVADYLIFNMKKNGAYELKEKDLIEQLEKLVVNEKGYPVKEFVGKNADYILSKMGIKCDDSIRAIIVEVPKSHPFVVGELMMPVLPIVRVNDVEEAIKLAVEVEHGFKHTAIMHSKNIDRLSKFAKEIQTTIFVKNGPSFAGIGVGGEGYATFTIAGPTGEGLTSAKSFARRRRCTLVGGFSIK
ncbi:aldehyde dehydrogenase family protein [Alkaliphilus peptidifermentans]|uniref:Propionaldehyde dehydrogenase n=1 Tax=Alkaliphilus peptidifermentans DSM 18978 TaxID=1120976 RepID=A0A1G5AAV0_9FIRM|nr:aldehyde dehydrogenase family protein [Alkaliphilus peptidifermentans]SCX74998.1 propionaldehyde dehydrogenase [Alkaliphilus peptidifermentans DSM 18978]